jgi:hypothetical protein
MTTPFLKNYKVFITYEFFSNYNYNILTLKQFISSKELRKRKNKEREDQEREAAAALMARAALIPMVQMTNPSFGVTGN